MKLKDSNWKELIKNKSFVNKESALFWNDCVFQNFVDNPESLWGKSVDEVGDMLGEGWKRDFYGSKKDGWKFTKGDKMIAYHPVGERHRANYYKISSANGIIKIVGQE